jgi:hypothetical protein
MYLSNRIKDLAEYPALDGIISLVVKGFNCFGLHEALFDSIYADLERYWIYRLPLKKDPWKLVFV